MPIVHVIHCFTGRDGIVVANWGLFVLVRWTDTDETESCVWDNLREI